MDSGPTPCFSSAAQVPAHADVIISGNPSDEFAEALRHTRPDQIIIDYVRILKEYNDVPAKCDGIAW